MKLAPIPGNVHKVGKVSKVSKGFTQALIITQPEEKNGQGYTLSKEQFFVIHIWSNKETDSRFLKDAHTGIRCIASVYLDGQRWQGRNGFEYNHKLNLDKWVEDEEVTQPQPKK
jgi:hypothetical protein